MKIFVLSAAFSLAAAAVNAAEAPLIVRGWTPATNDTRYDAVCGVTWNQTGFIDISNYFGSGVLIAPNVVLTARHVVHDSVLWSAPLMVSFRRNTDGSVGTVNEGTTSTLHNVAVTSVIEHATQDLALLVLADDVDHINPMRFDLATFGVPIGGDVQVAGWGKQCEAFDGYSATRGLNVLDGNRIAMNVQALGVPSAARVLLAGGYGSGGSACSTCVPTVNMYDSGGPIMRMDGDGLPTVLGVTVNTGQTFSMLTALTAANPDDADFLAELSSSIAPVGQLKFSSARPLTFDTGGKLFTRARIGTTSPYTYNTLVSSTNPLEAHASVNTNTSFTVFENGSSVASLVVTDIGAGSCALGDYEAQTVGYTEVNGAGDGSGVDTTFRVNVYSYGSIDHCDGSLKINSYYAPLSAVTPGASVFDAVVANVPFSWDYDRLNGGFNVTVMFTLGMEPTIILYEDRDADGTEEGEYEMPYSAGEDPPVVDENGFVKFEYGLMNLEPHGRYRVKVRMNSFFTLPTSTSPGCSNSGTFSKTSEQTVRVMITPF